MGLEADLQEHYVMDGTKIIGRQLWGLDGLGGFAWRTPLIGR
jgi:hypothetical protein